MRWWVERMARKTSPRVSSHDPDFFERDTGPIASVSVYADGSYHVERYQRRADWARDTYVDSL